MGGVSSKLSPEEYEWYEENTYFARVEITRLYKIFAKLTKATMVMPREQFLSLPELKHNPFRFRIFEVFCASGEHVNFSEAASLEIKSYFAFLIYDENEDDYLDEDDLNIVIESITRGELTTKEIKTCVDKILAEADIDGDGRLSYMEFEHIIQRSPDFTNTFTLRMI